MPVDLDPAIPILRIFDEALAREFYVDFLGFTVEFEHRFDENAPLYMGLSKGGCRVHLSGHFGDCSPGARLYIPARNIRDYAEELRGKAYKHARPGTPEDTPWGTCELTIADPFGNRLTFAET